jgi:hypothetical protein
VGAEHEGRQDREAGVLGGFGGVPALVEVLLIARARVRSRFAVANSGTVASPSTEKTSSSFSGPSATPCQVLVDFLLGDVESRYGLRRVAGDFPEVGLGWPAGRTRR